MKITLYASVSTSDGRQDAGNQLAPLREWASGSKADRAALTRLLPS